MPYCDGAHFYHASQAGLGAPHRSLGPARDVKWIVFVTVLVQILHSLSSDPLQPILPSCEKEHIHPIRWHPFPLVCAVLFAIHPLATDSVTYISSRSTVLMTFFYREIPGLIDAGHLYLAQPPLYRLTQDGKSEERYQETGIRQGCPLSPYRFIIVMSVL